ncbi:MAG: hypothetical protein KJ964_13475 [Verrucomicrobia bacterium]|nr:hypothetical protein [Verrucomicrobiota bacterium]MBU1734512.1 hypothetical protein [Verrucomicrobiota bacterium]MBU1857871.1 hypothetical protein [Verrucomicrobiota bacterium]
MKKQLGMCVVGLWLMAVNGFGQVPADPLLPPGVEGMYSPDLISMGLDELKARAATMLQQGDTNSAINVLMVCNEKVLQQSADEFNTLLNNLLTIGKLSEAECVYQNTIAQRDRLSRDYYNRLRQYYVSQSNAPAMLEWTASLQTKALPPDLRVQAFAWLFEASCTVGPVSRVTDLVPVCITNFDVPTSRGLLTGVITAYDSAGDQASANKVLDAIERTARRQAKLRLLVTCQRVNLLFSAARWKEAEAYFQKEAKALPDGELAGCFQYARACAIRTNQFDLLDRLCAWIFKEQKKKPVTWQAAASAWLESAKIRKATADIPVRLEALMQMGCPNNLLVSYYYGCWDVVVKEGKPADLVALLKFGDRLSAVVSGKWDKEMLRVYAINSCIILEDYERTLQLLEKPLPDMEGTDHANAVNKIKAHLALQKGNKPEAVERFRAFMETVKTWPEPEADPVTGLIYTKEMCLGLNAKRIGDILSSMNDAQGAQAAYREAGGYYAIAQKEVRVNSQQSEYVKARQTELAKLLKK